MALLTIGAFARTCRLSPKALRLYDDLGLLPPAKIDPLTGYRWYAPEQLSRARLVAWLRGVGMPLARIATVCDLPPSDASAEIAAYWAQVEIEIATRRELVSFLVEHLSRGETDMTDTAPLRLRWATHRDRGLVRERNQDAVWAEEGLLGVADGFGPATETVIPSTAALNALAVSHAVARTGALLEALRTAVEQVADTVRTMTTLDPALAGSGTTLTALAWSGSELALVHVGDSRAYLLRDGELRQLTHDDTLVQSLLDEGRLTREEAESHPQRMILVRALHAGATAPPDVRSHSARPGDRYLLCSDGLHIPVPLNQIQRVLANQVDPEIAAAELAELVHHAGAPDNVAFVVADVLSE
ncbi:MAG: MerR family transcriptional regulator [Pseudonocardiaceae bacterium]